VASLVFGIGYIGAALADHLCASGQHVVALDNGFATNRTAVDVLQDRWRGLLRVLEGDIRQRQDVAAAFAAAEPVETVYLLAAQASAHPQAAPPEYTEETNLRGPRLVLDLAIGHGQPPIVFGSSFHVYGSGLTGVVDETRPYGRFRDLSHLSKVYVEKLGEMYAGQHELGFAPLRLGVVYGIGPVTKRDLRFVTVPHAFCLRALAGETLRIHPSGLAPLGFVHLQDAVSALVASRVPVGYHPANAVSEVATAADVARVVRDLARERGRDAAIEIPDDGALHGPQALAVSSRLQRAGWSPRRTLRDSIGAIYDHYASRSDHRVFSDQERRA
jgi:nucleoside-diphosphate-sugar epimerase